MTDLITRAPAKREMLKSALARPPVTAAVVGDSARFPLLAGLALLIVWKHRENIRRLLAGEEPRVGRAKG